MLHNETAPAGHWLGIELIGTRSNRDGIGAQVTVKAGSKSFTRVHQLAGDYISAHDPRIHFGLGDASTVESVAVRWPSGSVDRVRSVPIDGYVRISEGRGVTPAIRAGSR